MILIPVGLQYSEAQQIEYDLQKFDSGFYEKIQKVSKTNTITKSDVFSYYSVILITYDKEDLVNDLEDDYNAINIFNPEHLDNVVTANVPINKIVDLSMNSNIVKIGDGELVLERATTYDPTNDTHISIKEAKEFHNWSNDIVQTGNYITVGVIDLFDDGPPHDDLPDSTIIERVSCTETGCSDISTSPLPFDDHFNLVVGVLAGSGLGNSDMQGIAHDSKIRFAIVDTTEHLVKALDYLVGKNVDVINMSAGRYVTTCDNSYTTQQHSTSLIIDHVVKIGTPFIDAAGNRNARDQFSLQGCGYGSIAVGNIDINGIINPTSSRGSIATPFIKPEIAALGTNIASTSIGSQYEVTSGTSFATPLVTGAASLLLEKDRGLTSEEIRTALLLGAEFNHADLYTIPIATASLYDTDGDPDIQTYMHQFGFGKLNIQNSLDAVNSNIFPNIHRDNIFSSSNTHEYRIYANSGEEVKIFMTWSIATAGSIDAVTFEGTFETALEALKNYNLKITKPDSTVILSNSAIQNKEFAYFTADQNGIYNIEVSVDGFGIPNREYVIGSNHAMDKAPFNDNFPINTDALTCQPDEICTVTTGVTPTNRSPTLSLSPQSISANSGETVTVTASAYDPDGDTVSISWEVEQEDIDINLSISGDSTTASFVVPHDDTITSATFVIEAVATDEHNASSATQDVTINAVISESTGPISGSVFFDNFENGNLDAWVVNTDWRADIFDEGTLPPDHLSGNKVAEADNCNVECVMTMSSGIDMTDNSDSAYLQFYRYVDGSLDSGEYLKIELYDGTNWVHLDTWSDDTDDNDDVWHLEKYSLSDYNSVTDFNIRFTGLMSSPVEDVGIDDVLVWTSSTVPPIFVSSPDITLTTTGLSERVFFVIPTADKGTVTCDHNQGDVFPLGTTTVTCTAVFEDVFSTTSFDVIISRTTDTTSPTITTPSDITVEATGPRTNINIGTAIATDDMDTNPTITNDAPSSFPVGVTIVTWTATDSSGNIATATQIITVQDTTPPTIMKPANKTFEATGERTLLTADDIGTATANDRVDPNPTVTSNIPQSFEFGVTTTIITWTATDSYGNSATATQIITVQDTTSPDITAPANVSFTTTDTSIALTSADYGTATATDLVDPSPTITSNAPPSFQADQTTTITWTATDKYLNSANATQSVTVVHSSLRIFVPADITVEAEHVNNIVNIGNANATHDTDPNITINNDAPQLFDVGVTVVTWTATDSIGVTVTDTQRITIQDTTDPILYSVPDLDFVFEIDIPIIINYDYPTATDLDNLAVDVACTPASGTIFNEDTTVVTCTATDDSGNTADTTFNVDVVVFDPNLFSDNFEDGNMDGWTVTDYYDTWAAVPLEANVYPPGHASTNKVAEVVYCDITCSMTTSGIDLSGHDDPIFLQFYRYVDSSPDNDSYFQVETYNGSSWVVFDKWIPDNLYHDGAWHLEQYSLSDYTHVRDFGMRFTAYMESSSESVGIDDVRVFFVPEQASDGTVPVIVPPVSIVAEATGALTTVDIGNATATPATNTTISSDAPVSFPLGSTTVTWTATDSSDNSDTATQRITIHDTTPPDITAPADASFTIIGTSIALTASDYGASTATDLIDSSPTIDSNAPDLFPLGNTTITWTATDDYGNSAQATQQVTVILSSLMITAPADITVEATGTLTTVDIGNAIATHDTDTDITITNDAPLSFRVGTTTTITWTATDSVNDVVTATQTIIVRDTTNPVFSSVTDLDFVFGPGVTLVIDYDSPTATDSVDASVDVTCVPASGTVFSGGTTGVTCTATDDSGNTADITFNVDVLVLSTTIFLDDFEDGRLNGWTVTDYSDTWDSYPQESGVNPPDHPSTNKVAQVSWCDITCTMSISGFDLSMHTYPEFLQFYRYVDDTLDNGEYLSLEVYDGSSWTELDRWTPEDSENDDTWHLEEYSLSSYTDVTDFGMRFTTVMSSLDEAVAIDDVKIFIVP